MGSKQLPMSSVFAMMGAGIIIILQMVGFGGDCLTNSLVCHLLVS